MSVLDTFLEMDIAALPASLQLLITDDNAKAVEVLDAYHNSHHSGFSAEDIVAAWQEFGFKGNLPAALDEYMWAAS